MDKSEIIIEEVNKYECLYNLASKNYKNVEKKTEIWNAIRSLVNLPDNASMANGKNSCLISSKCSVCDKNFKNSQECLKHELIKHILQRKSSIQKHGQKYRTATDKTLNANDKQTEGKHLKQEMMTKYENENHVQPYSKKQAQNSAGITNAGELHSIICDLTLKDNIKMATDTETNTITSKCSVCSETFSTVKECLSHELIKHSLQKKSSPQNRIQKRLNATAKFLNSEDKRTELARLKQVLSNCKKGEELRKIFELFCMKPDNLDLIFTRIQTCLEKELRPAGIARIYAFGSIASGLALRDSDIDMYLDVSHMQISPTHTNYKEYNKNQNDESHQLKAYNRITKLLYRSTFFTDVYAIRSARVPIIKCKHNDTGFSIDINVSYPSSRENTQFIHDLVNCDRRIHELMLFLKLWAKNTQIIGRDNMSSYCLITMVIFFLQQPRNSKNQKDENGDTRILKSIKELQVNCPFNMVQGVNYAYDLCSEENKPQIPATINTWQLIKEFFEFYQNYNFDDDIISPYYGLAISKTNLTPNICEDYYKQLKTITQFMKGNPANNLQIDRCMCVQDAFCLNQNTAKGISPQNKQYILWCLQNAKKICENPQKLKVAKLYEQLLFETVKVNATAAKENTINEEVLTNLKTLNFPAVEISTTTVNNTESNLTHILIPSKADLRALAAHYPNVKVGNEILHCWCQHYVNAIETIVTKLYRMDMQNQLSNQQKQMKLDEEGNDKDLNRSWLMCCSIDLWSNRCFQKNLQTTFMDYQLEQTERLHNLRRQDPKFSVTLNGILKLNIFPSYMGIEVKIELPDDAPISSLHKKSPLRKFFNIFKNTLQSCSFKDVLNIDNANLDTNKGAIAIKTTANAENINAETTVAVNTVIEPTANTDNANVNVETNESANTDNLNTETNETANNVETTANAANQ